DCAEAVPKWCVWRGWARSRLGRDSRDFLDAGDAGAHLAEPVLAEGVHALLAGDACELRLRRAGDGEVLDLLAHHHHREEPDPAAVAGVIAAAAPEGLVRFDVGAHSEARLGQRLLRDHGALLAIGAELACEPLGDDAFDR